MEPQLPNEQEFTAMVKDLKLTADKILEDAHKHNKAKHPSILRAQRLLNQILLGNIADGAVGTASETHGYGKRIVIEQKKVEPKVEEEIKQGEPGALVKGRTETAVNTEADTQKANEKFIKELSQVGEEDFRAKYNKPALLKSVAVVINELEKEEVIPVTGSAGNNVKTLQDKILTFLREDYVAS